MTVVKDWILEAAEKIYHGECGLHFDTSPEVISSHCPMKPDVAYMPVPRCDSCALWRPWERELGNCTLAEDSSQRQIAADIVLTHESFGCVQWKDKV